jgi:hypothetical protein
MDYEQMLRLNRFGSLGDPLFIGQVGEYFVKSMREKKDKLTPGEQVAVSKRIGWDP